MDERIEELKALIEKMAAEGYVFQPSEFDLSLLYVGQGEPTVGLTLPLA